MLQLAACVRYLSHQDTAPGFWRWWATCARCSKASSSWWGVEDCIGKLERHNKGNCNGGGPVTPEEHEVYRLTMMVQKPNKENIAWEDFSADLLSFLFNFRALA